MALFSLNMKGLCRTPEPDGARSRGHDCLKPAVVGFVFLKTMLLQQYLFLIPFVIHDI